MNIKPFYNQIWDSRLQVLWVIFAGLYVLIGNFTKARFISSILILIGGFLITAVFTHILIEENKSRARSTLFIALAATIFLIHESSKVFEDYVGTVAACFFAAMLMHLLWIPNDHPSRQILKYNYFSTMTLIILSSSLLLAVTLFEKFIIKTSVLSGGYYWIGPVGTGSLSALGAGFIIGGRTLQKGLPDFNHFSRKSNLRLVTEMFVFSVIASALACYFNEIHLQKLLNNIWIFYPLIIFYFFTIISMPVLIVTVHSPI